MSNEELLKAIGGLIDQKLEPIKKDISNIHIMLKFIEENLIMKVNSFLK